MDEGLKRNILMVGLAAVILLAALVVALRSCGGGDYARQDLTLDSADAREAIAAVGEMAVTPERATDHMATDARPNARAAVRTAAEAMFELKEVEPVDATWFGDYLRLTVACERDGAEPLELRFFFRREDGRLRITGMQQ
jgi:xanthine dehydrogenase iron-sulfur cluster and FAD-binding subunit A